eukprot:jgi/Mesvir1/14282/Mv09712-RA.1
MAAALGLATHITPFCARVPFSKPSIQRRCGTRNVLPRLTCRASYERDGPNEGNPEVQNFLVDVIRIETEKVRVAEMFDKKAELLRKIVEDADEEYKQIARHAEDTINAASEELLKSIAAESEFEQKLNQRRAEAKQRAEADAEEFENFAESVSSGLREGLYFKSMYPSPRMIRQKEEFKKRLPQDLVNARTNAKSQVMSGFLVFFTAAFSITVVFALWTMVEAFVNHEDVNLEKGGILLMLLCLLGSQLTYFRRRQDS